LLCNLKALHLAIGRRARLFCCNPSARAACNEIRRHRIACRRPVGGHVIIVALLYDANVTDAAPATSPQRFRTATSKESLQWL
jgi:hypothetical protein